MGIEQLAAQWGTPFEDDPESGLFRAKKRVVEDDDHETRSTGEKVNTLQAYDSLDDRRWDQVHGLSGTHQELFTQVFSGEILEDFFLSASASPQYEMNITSTSLNILTLYAGGMCCRAIFNF